MSVPYTDSEASEARQWSNRYGPPNAWTASLGTAARMIGRLLDERERLMSLTRFQERVIRSGDTACLTDAERDAIEWAAFEFDGLRPDSGKAAKRAATLRGLLERLG
jgi:nicotinic acid phosphoribosyltransferase